MNSLTRVPRRAVQTAMTVTRLPLTAVEALTGRRGSDWAPATAFSSVEATVLQVAGNVLHDEQMLEHGRHQAQAATRRQEAHELDAAAAAVDRRGRQQHSATLSRTESAVDTAQQAVDETEQRVERTLEERSEAVERASRSRKQAAARQAGQREKARQRATRAQTLTVLDEKAEAADATLEAVDAQRAAAQAAEQVDEVKKARRNGA